MDAPHAGQRDAGHTTDWRRGTRWITTFRKLPAMSPSRPDTTTIKGYPPTIPFAVTRPVWSVTTRDPFLAEYPTFYFVTGRARRS
jgi:hypothetical protein